MEVSHKRPRCKNCESCFDFPLRTSSICKPCSLGQSSFQLTCLLCGLLGGELVQTLDGQWIHVICGFIACDNSDSFSIDLPRKKKITDPPGFLQLKIPEDAYVNECAKCLGVTKPMATASCYSCHKRFHYSCFLRQSGWDYSSSFECGCRGSLSGKSHPSKRTKKVFIPDYEPIRVSITQAPTASSVLKGIFEEVVRLDEWRLFRTETANTPFVLPTHLVVCTQKTFTSKLSASILSSEDGFDCEIDLRDTAQKVSTKCSANLISDLRKAEGIVEESEPHFVADFTEYENSLITSLDWLYTYRVSEHYYFTLDQLLTDLRRLIDTKLDLCEELEGRKYVKWFWVQAAFSIQQRRKDFEKAVRNDWRMLLDQSKGVPVVAFSTWSKLNAPMRTYTSIRDFCPVSDPAAVMRRLNTQILGCCDGTTCSDIALLGPFDLVASTWKSRNPCRARRTECSDKCGCDPQRCKNRQLARADNKKLGVDVVEKPTWGFDVLTYRTILAYLRQPLTDDMHTFIAKKLPKAINRVAIDPWEMRNAASLIVSDTEYLFTLKEQRYAQGLLNAINGLTSLLGSSEVSRYFRIHPKGTGVVCTNKAGIEANELIAPYLGELYTPSRWYELQDVTKALLKTHKNFSGQLPDFYNIMLERQMEDPDGYDVLMIDPIVKGTFGSRLSHSCTPNCGTVAMVANGRYTIGMYALEPIEYGQELTFDYHSVTESREEFNKAICLCSASVCRGHYLSLAKPQFPEFVEEEHGFLMRIGCIVRAGGWDLTKEDEEVLTENSLKERALGETVPWLRKWAAEVVRAIVKKVSELGDEYECRSTYSWYLQQLVLTLDRVKHCLAHHFRCHSSTPPPMVLLSESEILAHLWSDHPSSIRGQLIRLYRGCFPAHLPAVSDYLSVELKDLTQVRMHLLALKDHLKTLGTDEWACQGVADMLHLVAYTRFWVKENEYESFKSEQLDVRYCDIMPTAPEGKRLDEVWMTDQRSYSPTYIKDALTWWFKQSVEKPTSLLLREKRGSLILPSLDSVGVGWSLNIYKAPMRKWLLDFISQKPQQPWPDKLVKSEGKPSWSHFDYTAKVLGSPMLDSAVLQDNWKSLRRCMNDIDRPAIELLEYVQSFAQSSKNG